MLALSGYLKSSFIIYVLLGIQTNDTPENMLTHSFNVIWWDMTVLPTQQQPNWMIMINNSRKPFYEASHCMKTKEKVKMDWTLVE